MNGISLEWFFEIPGLFITIGVLLILIALLVLIIGSSKARKQKNSIEENIENNEINVSNNNTIQEPIANPTETVNVVGNIPTLPINNNVVSDNKEISENINNITPIDVNSVNDNMVNVNNNDNIMPVAEVGANVVTPVNEINIVSLSDNNVVTDNQSDVNTQPVSIQQEPIASPTVEPINSTEPVIIPPIINNIENNEVSQVSNLVNDSIVVTPVEQTPITNENINNVSFEGLEPISTNVEPSIEPVASEQILSQPLSTVVPENNTNDINQIQPETNTGVDNQIETTPIETQPLPQEPENTLTSEQMPQPEVPFAGNPIEGTITMPVIDNPKENEIEEIL